MKVTLSDYTTGSRVATELVNTAPSVRRIGGEALADVADLREFLRTHMHPIGGAAHGRSSNARDLHEVLKVRDKVRAVLDSPSLKIVARANELVSRHRPTLGLVRDDDGHDDDDWQWSVTTPRDASIADELEILAGTGILATVRALGRERIRACAADDCDGVFVDTSRAGRRRYCSPGLCGNRANVARFRSRQRSEASGT